MNFSSDPINNLENLIAKNKTKSISIYVVVVLGILVFLSLLPVIKVDISSQSRGTVRSTTDNVPLTSLVNGKVTFVNLKNNRVLQKGDTLVKLTLDNLDTEKATNQTLSTTIQNQIQDLSLVVLGKSNLLKTPELQQEWYSYSSKRDELLSKIAQAKIGYDRSKQLYDKGVIAKAEFEKYSFEFTYAQQALSGLEKNQRSVWQNKKRELQEQLQNLNGTLQKINVEAKNYVVIAPLSGIVENFSGIQVGSFLNASQPIATISATDQLIVESTVSPNDIGLIQKNQKVKFQIDAFNYNQWGLLEGKVIDIDRNITIQGEQTFFKVRCALNSTVMKLQSGYKTHVSKGMTLTIRYIITRRSLYDLLFDKVDDWLNPKQVTK
ncbi:HlyD family secretion protein [Flavobacterium gawalongense]|uniref:HlyD family efflux transporter periplasmic adaptor subunit n=1 Tax=Flavobacterium gawalongense TaxID=2594432 RepID=A0A553BWW6_9FLAO|nr:HlyD family efflux transporter periplasmic adaptor subunit [Flavobacterium gawalongense]TRX04171.1 HlyD family efflux transporter periplasmic adaptor subunit [Flavobacterium gawalongense]TRX09379.1 HlyD family efflux transporter periplasmic adaptor subunit [Flavobacterium gawalongense]TRX12807.1 HlyD family efflux transporter periplasmic adaptor subunit [Flavobacterium gawalongense]TRX13152.1 HlyD family efflux transporter periplasmic adaptor subunit [Flavobacterium gawalongense]TRX30786.1 